MPWTKATISNDDTTCVSTYGHLRLLCRPGRVNNRLAGGGGCCLTYFRRRHGVSPAHGPAAGAGPPVRVGRVPPGPGGRRGGRRRTGRGRRWTAHRMVVDARHVQLGPVVHAHGQQGHFRAAERRSRRGPVPAVPVYAERVAGQHDDAGRRAVTTTTAVRDRSKTTWWRRRRRTSCGNPTDRGRRTAVTSEP